MNRLLIFLTIVLLTGLNAAGANPTIEALLREGGQYQRSGAYLDAQAAYQRALEQAEQQQDEGKLALAKSALGYIAYLRHQPEQAEPLLEHALTLAKKHKNNALIPVTEYYLGLTANSRQHLPQAKAYLQQALSAATQANDLELISRCHLALAQITSTLPDFKQQQQLALTNINQLKSAATRGELRLLLAEQCLDHPHLPELNLQNAAEDQRLASVYQQLTLAFTELPADNLRGIAQYHGLLGHVYESQQRYEDALTLTKTALKHAQTLNADDLKLFYNWQAARLYSALHQQEPAIASYRQAISAVQSMRQDIPVTYQDGKSSFLKLFGPLYRGASALLLQQASNHATAAEQKPLLTEARGLMERLKQTELEDFFKDRCLLSDVQLNTAPVKHAKTAVFYPIILPDRIELLLSTGDQLFQHTVAISGKTLDYQIRQFARNLRGGIEYKEASQQLYDWLIKPLEADLHAQHIDTLLYVPDGPLRLLPLAALSDGQHYLLERYTITTAPSLALITSTPKTGGNNALLAGLSEPGLELSAQLSEKLLRLFNSTASTNPDTSDSSKRGTQRSIAANLRKLDDNASSNSLLRNPQQIAKILALAGVTAEIDQLSAKLPSKVILNSNYTLHNFDHAVAQTNYDVVHIASHGYFGGSYEDSFILTYDKLLLIDHLEELLKSRGQRNPIDLIVLSACQTAEGDDRAPLGLAGVALKANANHALGSLWSIDDAAAVKVMLQFYEGFKKQGLTKAKALQQAQLSLLQDKNLASPYFWAPFILVGNAE
jgi:CHAT domain-containing protein